MPQQLMSVSYACELPDPKLDQDIQAVAEANGGDGLGCGYTFGDEGNLGHIFPDESSAETAAQLIRAMAGTSWRVTVSYDTSEDS
jgi:hypothetical protein